MPALFMTMPALINFLAGAPLQRYSVTTLRWSFATKKVNISSSAWLYQMSNKRAINLCFSAFILALALASVSAGQKPSGAPRQEKLLNGLKVLVWNVPAAEKVS